MRSQLTSLTVATSLALACSHGSTTIKADVVFPSRLDADTADRAIQRDSGEDPDDLTDIDDTDSDPIPTPCTPYAGPQIESTLGCIRGITREGGDVFMGVPYAQPPVGDLRWRRPRVPDAFSAPYPADQLADLCIQAMAGVFGETEFGDGGEDCLYLNIYRPADAENLPILFFSHGGGLASGGASLPVYIDDPQLAKDAIVVTYQYRLGPLGFLAHPDLSDEDPQGTSGNYGFFDALMALQFVHDNAAALGGDPDKLMIFGESAGGLMTHTLLTSPLSRGLFTSAIIQSSTAMILDTTLIEEEAYGLEVASSLNCTDLDCMRAVPALNLVEAAPGTAGLNFDGHQYVVNVDGVVLPDAVRNLVARGEIADVPVIIGATQDEAFPFTDGIDPGDPQTLDTWIQTLGALIGISDTSALSDLYTADSYGSPSAAFNAFYGDAFVICPTRSWARLASEHIDVRTYLWTRHLQVIPSWGAYHGVELPFVFGTLYHLLDSDEEAMSSYIQDTWVSAARGTPSVGGQNWPRYDATTDEWMMLDLEPSVQSGVRSEVCDFLEAEGWPSL